MRLTTKGRFAVTAMIDIAMYGTKGPVTLAGVSDRQKISLSYLEQLFGKLRRAGLVESVRGPGGGYRLARPADAVSVADVITAVDEPIDATKCGGPGELQGRRQALHDARAVVESQCAHLLVSSLGESCATRRVAGRARRERDARSSPARWRRVAQIRARDDFLNESRQAP